MRAWLALLLAVPAFAFQVPRDVRKEPAGTATIGGIVQTTDETPRPLRLAIVTLAGDALLTDRQFVTSDGGRFEFPGLPAGHYTLTAYKSSYMRQPWGAKRQGGSGAQIALANGEKVSNLSIPLSKYGVITGVIYDATGEPAQGVSVEVMAYTMRTGRRTLSSVYGRPETTDDRGVYRAAGLVPGEYFVAAGPSSFNSAGELQVLSAAEIDLALRGVAPGAPLPSPTAAPVGPPARVNFAPVFFPGAAELAGATKITLKLGEERAGVDFALRLLPVSRIDGVVTGPDGQPAPATQIVATMVTEAYSLDLFRGTLGNARPDAQGRFSYSGLSPGRYVITARSVPDPSVTGSPSSGPLWAMADVSVNGADQTVSLALQPGLSVSGKVVFDGTTAQRPASLSTIRVTMPPAQTTSVSIGVSPPAVSADGTFTITGAAPGTYRLTATPPAAAAGWALRSAIVSGVDTLDVPFEIKPGQSIDGAVLTFTDHPTVLSGTLQTSGGIPASNYFIIVFAADKAMWTPSSRRTVMVRPTTTGTYVLRNLPPGDYLVAAVTDVEFNAWFDPAFLEQLLPAATRITLSESETKTLDLKIDGLR